ncbi:hypothetical protein [Cryptosporangium phraense]|uniref:Uncharacterized protein n=1 Tax=Cryptosporangium phraense TaxID=2593070 RepID=A0A545AFU1_9ACTN|nr:hypothetical protein [Cryptosporangium phraense]TQS39505.1 hypothetical protein FL583_39665 [Cryptosporangium phraense]
MGRVARVWTALACVGVVTACASGAPAPDRPASPSPAGSPSAAPGASLSADASPTGVPVASSCPADAVLDPVGLSSRRGVGAAVTAIFFAPAVTVGREVKIVWQMPGTAGFTVHADGPGGARTGPVWGPAAHSEPDQWGTGWVFRRPGCWTFVATRADGAAQLTVRVGR